MAWLKQKVDAGADYIVTQMFFNNQKYFEFVDNCRKMDINIPIIPGIKPLTTKKQLTALPKIFHIDLPDDLVNAVDACKDDKAVKQVGIEWAIQQSKELKAGKVPVLHYYTMGVSETTKAIASQVF
jgi:methylenetetrahydrofolate reductase (NADPH)